MKISPELIRLLIYAARRDISKGSVQGAEGFSNSLASYINTILEGKEIRKPIGWDDNTFNSDWKEFLTLIKNNM